MTDLPGGEGAAASIHAAFAREVTYTGAGLSAEPIPAVRTQGEAPAHYGDGTLRTRGYELRKANLAGDPRKGDLLVDGGTDYAVIEAEDRDDVDAWVVWVEAA